MLFSLRSIVLFSSLITASELAGLVAIVPVPAAPVVTPAPVLTSRPEDWAVPALLVPGVVGEPAVLPAALPLPAAPAPCANKSAGVARITIAAIAAVAVALIIANLHFAANGSASRLFPEQTRSMMVE
jgi:hypothetical protein